MSVTETVIEPAGPALTTTVRFPGLGGTLEPGTVVVGAVLVVGTVVVDDTVVVVGALDVEGVAEVVGVELVVGLELVDGVELVDGLCDVGLAWLADVGATVGVGCALNATAAVTPTHSAIAAAAMTNLRGFTVVDLL